MQHSSIPSKIIINLDNDENFLSFDFLKSTCDNPAAADIGLSSFLHGKPLQDIVDLSFDKAIKDLNANTEEDAVHRELALLKIKNVKTNKSVVSQLLKKHNAKVINEDDNALIIVQTGTTDGLNEFEKVIKKYGVIEMVRSGKLVMSKGRSET